MERGILTTVLRRVLGRPLADGDLDFLSGRVLAVHVLEVGRPWLFGVEDGQLRMHPVGTTADASIHGSAEDFLLMASRRRDPDTLFFQRRIVVEGDTELGLAVKNLLDSLEPADLPAPLDWMLQRAADLAEAFDPR